MTFRLFVLVLSAALLSACDNDKPASPDVDSQTHWMEACQEDADCGAARCVCGVCSLGCEADSACTPTFGAAASCQSATAPVTAAVCKDFVSDVGLCLPRCEGDVDCAAVGPALVCTAGACVSPSVEVEVEGDPAQVCALPEGGAGEGLLESPVDSFGPSLVEVEGGAALAWVDGLYGGAEVVVGRVDEVGVLRWSSRVSAWPGQAASPSVAASEVQVAAAWEDVSDPDHRIPVVLRGLGDGAGQGEVARLGEVSEGEVVSASASPQVLWGGDGWLVAWRQRQERCCPTVASWVQLARLSPAGALEGAPVALTAPDGEVGEARLILAEGGLALAWAQEEGVRWRRFTAAGAPLGEEVAVSAPGARPGRVALAWNGQEGAGARYALAWEDERAQADQAQLFVAQVDGAGVVLDGEVAVTDVGKQSRHPWLGWGEGAWALRWVDEVAVRQPAGVQERALSAQGLAPGESALLVTMEAQSGGMSSSGGAVAWSSVGEAGQAGPRREVFFARVGAGGALASSPVALSARDGRAGLSLALGPSGGGAAWLDERALGASGARALLYAPLTAAGARAGAPIELARGEVEGLSLASSGDEVAVAWVQGASPLLARVSAQGAPLGAAARFGAGAEAARLSREGVAWEASQRQWALAWWEGALEGGGEVYFQRASEAGAPVGAPLLLGAGAGEAPGVVAAPWGAAAAWRGGDGALALARVGADGALLEAPQRWEVQDGEGAVALGADAEEVAVAWWGGGLWLRRWSAQGVAGEARLVIEPALVGDGNPEWLRVFAVDEGWLVVWQAPGAGAQAALIPDGAAPVTLGRLPEGRAWEAVASGAEGFVGLWVEAGGAPAVAPLTLLCP